MTETTEKAILASAKRRRWNDPGVVPIVRSRSAVEALGDDGDTHGVEGGPAGEVSLSRPSRGQPRRAEPPGTEQGDRRARSTNTE